MTEEKKHRQKGETTHMSVAMYPGAIPFTCTFSLLHSLLSALVSCPSAPLAAAYAGTVNPPCRCGDVDMGTEASTWKRRWQARWR